MLRYHPLLVALHWLMALMIILALVAGSVLLAGMPNGPEKVQGLGGHMTIGIAIGVLLLVRLLTRLNTTHPPDASTGNALLDRVGRWTHWAFYILVAGMVLSGLAMAFGNGLFEIVFGGAADRIPDNLGPARAAHGVISTLLIGLVLLHIAAAVYHQFLLKDGLLRRMWFGRRS
ncbi:MAG: cytochrome b/b6 domain-containing protein [Pseudomonadota bacterium]